jgi:DNA repair protein RadC
MPHKNLTIKQWSPSDQPREKLRDQGARFLSNAELIAILIGSGTLDVSAVDLSKIILSSVQNNLNALGKLSLKKLMQFKGIGEAKAIKITAAMELGRRHKSAQIQRRLKISSSQTVFDIMQPLLGSLEHEEFWVIYLNNSNSVLYKLQISKGGITGTVVDVRLILKKAIELAAVAIILVHNHPSGTLRPSDADRDVTQNLKKAASTLEIKVLDHLILTEKTYFSFADENML